jgi:hypothetical protein
MPKKSKKTHHRKAKHKRSPHSHLAFGPEIGGHHARLRKLHAARGHDAGQRAEPHQRKGRKKATKRHAKSRSASALMERLRKAAAGARERLKKVGGRKAQRPEKPVTEQTLRDHLALKCVRRCSH